MKTKSYKSNAHSNNNNQITTQKQIQIQKYSMIIKKQIPYYQTNNKL